MVGVVWVVTMRHDLTGWADGRGLPQRRDRLPSAANNSIISADPAARPDARGLTLPIVRLLPDRNREQTNLSASPRVRLHPRRRVVRRACEV